MLDEIDDAYQDGAVFMKTSALLVLSTSLACMITESSAQGLGSSRRSISYHTVNVQGIDVFYREAGRLMRRPCSCSTAFHPHHGCGNHYCRFLPTSIIS